MVLQSSLFFLCCFILHQSAGINFYPYGTSSRDLRLPLGDDSTTEIPVILSPPFPFFGRRATSLYVNNNGVISLDEAYNTQHTPTPFPLPNDELVIAPFWADVDTSGRRRGVVYYRNASSNTSLLERAQREVLTYFTSGMNFQPTFLFIATWDRVSFFGGGTSRLTNTFQCVLVSDGVQSYALFLYELIQWTTGINSRGIAAQVGFNGDRNYFTVPESRTPAIINITNTSNVGVNGVWAFRLDRQEGGCDRRNPLTSTPTVGNILGGTVILLGGPCFSQTEDIRCTFDGSIEVPGFHYSENFSYCVSPYFENSGWKDLQVTVWPADGGMMPVYTGSSRFYARPLEEVSDVAIGTGSEIQPNSLLVLPGNIVMVTWNTLSLFPMNSSSFTVDVVLLRFELSGILVNANRTVPLATLSSNEANNGSTFVTIPPTSLGGDVYAVSIAIMVSGVPQGSINLGGVVGRVKSWSRLFFYSQGTSSLLNLCQGWIDQQEPDIGETILNDVVPCPRTARQARALNSGLKEDRGISQSLSRNIFQPGVDSCFRQASFSFESLSGQQCCYWSNGSLATGSPSGGTVDKVSPDGSLWKHLVQDVLPYIYCCFLPQSDCAAYYRHRPSDNGSRYNPPPPACAYGDPHLVTLDGYKYTFNGRGEFILIQTTDNSFSLQGRMVPAEDNEGSLVQATVFSALAAKEEFSSTVQIQLTEDEQSLEMLVNGELVDFSIITEQQFSNVTVAKRGNNSLSATFSSGAYIEARASNSILSTVVISLSMSYRGDTRGLMGNFNGNRADDLIERGGAMIPITSSIMAIHAFGLSWIIDDVAESLFTYSNNESFSSYHDPAFLPTFDLEFTDPELETEARQICGNDQFCLFDIAATGRLEIGLGTAQGNLEFEAIVNITTPATCSPPCINGACVAKDTCSCTSGYQGVGCTEPVILPCDVNPCENGGSCQLQASSYICSCPQAFSGIRCQNTDVLSPSTPASSGSGIGVVPDCTCQRPIECSIYGKFEDETGIRVVSSGENLRCVISSMDLPAEMVMGVGPGSGMMASPADPIFIDNTFNAEILSPGSFLFLREIGLLSRSQGITQCSLVDISGSDSMALSEFLNLRGLSIVYENNLNQYRTIAVDRNQLGQLENLSFQELDMTQQCAVIKIIEALVGPPSQQQYFCRDSNARTSGDTIITFTVSCT